MEGVQPDGHEGVHPPEDLVTGGVDLIRDILSRSESEGHGADPRGHEQGARLTLSTNRDRHRGSWANTTRQRAEDIHARLRAVKADQDVTRPEAGFLRRAVSIDANDHHPAEGGAALGALLDLDAEPTPVRGQNRALRRGLGRENSEQQSQAPRVASKHHQYQLPELEIRRNVACLSATALTRNPLRNGSSGAC